MVSEREEAEVASSNASSLNMVGGAESPPQAVSSSQDTMDGRRAAWLGVDRPLARKIMINEIRSSSNRAP